MKPWRQWSEHGIMSVNVAYFSCDLYEYLSYFHCKILSQAIERRPINNI